MPVALDFRVSDVAAVHGERLAPGQCVDLALAIDVVVKGFLEESLPFQTEL
jgi:hypothetical protein